MTRKLGVICFLDYKLPSEGRILNSFCHSVHWEPQGCIFPVMNISSSK